MSYYELVDGDGDSGMLVVGPGVDFFFSSEAVAHHRPDERLIKVSDPEKLLEPKMLTQAAVGWLATRAAHEQQLR